MKFSILPMLFMIQVFAVWYVARRAERFGAINRHGIFWINILLAFWVLWAVISSALALNGIYQSAWFLGSWPTIWVTMIPVMMVMIPLALSGAARTLLRELIDATPLFWLVGFQALRILAIGGIAKALNGEFSRYFGLYIGIPDFIFGVSALFMAWLVYRNKISGGMVAFWNLIGAMIIVPGGLVLLQMGLPGPWHVFTASPTILTIFEFPMALAPTVVVPIFIMLNLLIALRLIERSISDRAELTSRQNMGENGEAT
ncbi:MAG: hypothetical protein HQ514_06755 [Rhodospirillales bacterium]|nr:hypothetical protein [Rhodospirillales bacterium]